MSRKPHLRWVLGISASLLVFGLWQVPRGQAEDLFHPNSFSALASDRRASHVGDSLTVIINETTTATNSNKTSSAKSTSFLGQLSVGASNNRSIQLGANNNFDGSGETSHAGRVLAQLSVIVDEVRPNGDMHVSGYQSLNINGEHVRIKISGNVRAADISNTNSILSTNLADAVIDYDGKGFVAQSAKPGIVARVFSWLGLI